MKCWTHSNVDAVAVCKSCGKSVCRDCLVLSEGYSYCKDCAESGRVAVTPSPSEPTVTESVPVSKGTPKKAFFVVGGIGCFINAIVAIWFFFRALDLFALSPSYAIFSWIISHILLAIGLILASIGYFGMRRNFGSGIGLAGFAVGIVVSVLFLLWTVWDFIVEIPMDSGWLLVVYFEVTVYNIFFIMMILWGITHVTTRRFTGKSGLSSAAGMMLIMTSIFLEIFDILLAVFRIWDFYGYLMGVLSALNLALGIFDLIWTFLFFVSEILAAILFFTAKVPESVVKPSP